MVTIYPNMVKDPKIGNHLRKRTSGFLYRTANYGCVNADYNGAANIILKVSRKLGLNLSRLCRGVLTRPHRIKLWSVNEKKLG